MRAENRGGWRTIFAIAVASLLAIAAAAYWHDRLDKSEPPLGVEATDLVAAYVKNAAAADQQFANRTLLVSGMAGGTQLEGADYVLTIVPGVRAHLGSQTGGADMFDRVQVRCDGLSFADSVIDLKRCQISIREPAATEAASEQPACDVADGYSPILDRELAAAFQAATGHMRSFCGIDESGSEIVTSPLRILQLPFGKALLTESKDPSECHACNGALGIYYLAGDGVDVTVKARWPAAIKGWGFGQPPQDWQMTDKFTAFPAIYTEGGYMQNGESSQSASITELTPNGPRASSINLGYSNVDALGEGTPCDFAGKITNIRRDRSFDVQMTGSHEFTDHYVKQGDTFAIVGGKDWHKLCE